MNSSTLLLRVAAQKLGHLIIHPYIITFVNSRSWEMAPNRGNDVHLAVRQQTCLPFACTPVKVLVGLARQQEYRNLYPGQSSFQGRWATIGATRVDEGTMDTLCANTASSYENKSSRLLLFTVTRVEGILSLRPLHLSVGEFTGTHSRHDQRLMSVLGLGLAFQTSTPVQSYTKVGCIAS